MLNKRDEATNRHVSLDQGFSKLLNAHGYGFQYSVLEVVKRLYEQGTSKWQFEVSEFPVRVQGQDTRVDLVLKCASAGCYMVGECKRVDPKFSDWCFVRAPSVKRDHRAEMLVVDRVEVSQTWAGVQGIGLRRKVDDVAYHIGLTLKSREEPGQSSMGRNAIEEAMTQVCRGANGLIELLVAKRGDLMYGNANAIILPVVFTTAKLWVSNCSLASANLNNGSVEAVSPDLQEKPWICYQYHVSPGLKHSCDLRQHPRELADALSAYYIRTIPVVNAAGIETFLKDFDPTSFL